MNCLTLQLLHLVQLIDKLNQHSKVSTSMVHSLEALSMYLKQFVSKSSKNKIT